VIAVVVQPGVEFDHHKVIDYRPELAVQLSRFIESDASLIFEAHSTDYQTGRSLRSLVQDHFAILKVGPAVTFALREALWALADIEDQLLGKDQSSQFKQLVVGVMKAEPKYWNKYYSDPFSINFDLQFSLSDRIRYYWSHPSIQAAQAALLNNLNRQPIPLTLLSQYLPGQYQAIRRGELTNNPEEILIASVTAVLHQYDAACTMSGSLTCQ